MICTENETELEITENVLEEPVESFNAESAVSMYFCMSCKRLILFSYVKFVENSSSDIRYLCPTCSKTLKDNLFEAFKCIKCNDIFVDITTFKKHWITCKESFQCIQCRKKFETERLLLVHSKYHEIPKEFQCDRCEVKFLNLYLFNLHLISHNDESRPFTCKLCQKIFKSRHSLIFHSFNHLGKNLIHSHRPISQISLLGNYECSACKKIFCNRTLRLEHFVIFHSKKIGNCFICKHCHLIFKGLTGFEMHFIEYVNCKKKQTFYSCAFCPRKFVSFNRFCYHLLWHTDNLYECLFCKTIFCNKNEMQLHACPCEKKICSTSEMILCNVCGAVFRNYRGLTIHTRKAHSQQ